MGTFPRDVVISPGFGAGFATWIGGDGYEIAEHPEVVEACRRGADEEEVEEIITRLFPDVDHPYLGGWKGAVVETVPGPYYIDEYDGSETVVLQASDRFRT